VTTTNRHLSRRRLDLSGVVLSCIGLVSGAFSYWLISAEDVNAIVIVPSIVSITVGAMHLTKREAPRR